MPDFTPMMKNFPDALDFNDPASIVPLFDMSEIVDGISCTVLAEQRQIRLCGTIGSNEYSLTVDLSGAGGHTAPWQIVTAAKLFFYCYPQMYVRFGHGLIPRDVTLRIENFGYEIAEAWDDQVHIHDRWLQENPLDFDCLTHEFAHTVQGDWLDGYMPIHEDDTYMVERFADYCRYLYSYQNGRFNDQCWELQTPDNEGNCFDSVRFWVWLDYTYSTSDRDIIKEMNTRFFLRDSRYEAKNWEPDGSAWQEVFAGTGAAGKDLFTLWEEYLASGVAYLSSGAAGEGEASPLLQSVSLREAIRDRYCSARTYLNTL